MKTIIAWLVVVGGMAILMFGFLSLLSYLATVAFNQKVSFWQAFSFLVLWFVLVGGLFHRPKTI